MKSRGSRRMRRRSPTRWRMRRCLGDLAKKALAIHPERELPRFARRTFRSWFERRTAPRASTREVVLFPDTFNNFFEPHVAIAAVEVLERAGFRVIVPRDHLCCGRPLYDQGMLERAKARLRDVMDALDPFVAVGIPIVGLEPSCILTFRDELPSLFSEDPRAKALASNSFLLDEFLAREAPDFATARTASEDNRAGTLSSEGACGNRRRGRAAVARGGRESRSARRGMLRDGGGVRLRPRTFRRIETDRRASFDSRNRQRTPPDAIIVADGFSCRSQIRHFCPSRTPMHLAEVLNLPVG